MTGSSMGHPWAFAVGIIGNLISLMVYLAPLPTFYRVYRKKSTEGFQSVPYVVALFSATLWIYYAILKADNAYLLITINSIGCFIEAAYIIVFIFYAPKSAKFFTSKLVFLLNIGVFGLIVLLTYLLSEGSNRARIAGWICVGFSMCVFVAPLSVIRLVMKTKSVEFMPFSLSCSLTLSAIVWLVYGVLTKDIYVGLPNVVGIAFGVIQMVIYMIYKGGSGSAIAKEHGLLDHIIIIPMVGVAPGSEVHPIDRTSSCGDEEQAADGGGAKESVGGQEGNEMGQLEV